MASNSFSFGKEVQDIIDKQTNKSKFIRALVLEFARNCGDGVKGKTKRQIFLTRAKLLDLQDQSEKLEIEIEVTAKLLSTLRKQSKEKDSE